MLNKTLIFLIVICTSSACGENNNTEQNKFIEPNCLISQSDCYLDTEEGRYELSFNVEKVITESAFSLFLNYQGDSRISKVSAYIEGKEMFMGKIPVFFSLVAPNQYKAETILGSCSKDQMVWRLWVEISLIDINDTITSKTIFYDFESTRG